MGLVLKDIASGIAHLILISFLFFLIGSYFIRMFLWNSYGKEIFIIKEKSLIRIFDYRLFKSEEEIINFEIINIELPEDRDNKPTTGNENVLDEVIVMDNHFSETYLTFKTNKTKIMGILKLPYQDIIAAKKELNEFLK